MMMLLALTLSASGAGGQAARDSTRKDTTRKGAPAAKPAAKPATAKKDSAAAHDMHGMHDMSGMARDTASKSKAPARRTAPPAKGEPTRRETPMQHDMSAMGGAAGDTMRMAMPIPMPAGMPMLPGLHGLTPPVTPFLPHASTDPSRLPLAKPTTVIRLKNGDTLDLTAGFVRRMVGKRAFAAYAFNGQVPGPMIRVMRNATVIVRFHNKIDLPSTVHWHGLRLDNRYDGVPGLTQEEVQPGGSFTYRVYFPDEGIYWYHPHVREDIEQSMGLYGNMMVDSPEPNYYSPVNREQSLVLSDLMAQGDSLIPFGAEGPDFALSGRIGNVLLVNNEPRHRLLVRKGEVVRFFLTNVSNSRTYNLSFGGARTKIVASDVSRFEREEWVESVVLAPAERYVVEVRFDKPGRYAIMNQVQAINHVKGEFELEADTLGVVTVGPAPAVPDYARPFDVLRANAAVTRDVDRFRPYFDKAPDKRLTLTLQTSGLPVATVQFMNVDTAYFAPVEWVDGMPDMNWLSTSKQVRWILRDPDSGQENMDIDWHVPAGSVVKLRVFNDPKSFHPMQHPIHLHGQRMLVVARDGVRTRNLVWKDTALIPVGQTVDLLIDTTNPGAWMLHCHIAEHLGSGMMAVMHVDPAPGK